MDRVAAELVSSSDPHQVTFYMTHVLTLHLAFYLTYILPFYVYGILSDISSGILFGIFICLTFYLALCLTFYLTVFCEKHIIHSLRDNLTFSCSNLILYKLRQGTDSLYQ